MREIFKGFLKEFRSDAYVDLYCMDEDGTGPVPMTGDRFFLFETTENDPFDSLVIWSIREEEFFEWNTDMWVRIPDEKVHSHLLEVRATG